MEQVRSPMFWVLLVVMPFCKGSLAAAANFVERNLSPNRAFTDSIKIGVKLGIGHLGGRVHCLNIHCTLFTISLSGADPSSPSRPHGAEVVP